MNHLQYTPYKARTWHIQGRSYLSPIVDLSIQPPKIDRWNCWIVLLSCKSLKHEIRKLGCRLGKLFVFRHVTVTGWTTLKRNVFN